VRVFGAFGERVALHEQHVEGGGLRSEVGPQGSLKALHVALRIGTEFQGAAHVICGAL
jgi:hypothetical protein